MPTFYDTLVSNINVEEIENRDGIQMRFEDSFYQFLKTKKYEAILETLQEDFRAERLLRNQRLVQHIVEHVNDEAIQEKPYSLVGIC